MLTTKVSARCNCIRKIYDERVYQLPRDVLLGGLAKEKQQRFYPGQDY